MGENLLVLGLQAIPRLAEKLDVDLEDFSTFSSLYGKTAEEFRKAYDNCRKILNNFMEKHRVSWWDVYSNSDVGMERMALARDIGLEEGNTVLEIGSGRGYFTVAAAKFSKRVIGLDIMDGGGRYGWWKNFRETTGELDLKRKIIGLKADAQIIPVKERSVNKAVAVHCMRNLQNKQAIQNALREMYRVLSKHGEMIVAESMPVARNKSQEAHLAFYNCKCKYDQGDLFYFSKEEILEMFRKAGLREVETKIVDYNLSAAPPIFYLNTSLLKKKLVEKAQKEYADAVNMVKKYGETSPPALIVKVAKN
jgi:ubiquinone/menaquinone biosynthesis C-methylase UbiE